MDGRPDLVDRARHGDRDAFGALAEARIDRLYAVAARVVRDPHRAEDAVQGALLQAWRDLPDLRDPARFDAWLHRLLMRACFREAGRHRAFLAKIQFLTVEPVGPDDFVSAADRDQVERALGQLPIAQRAVVVLHHYQGLPLADVADALGIPTGTARSRLHYAMRSLRAAVEADERVPVQEGGRA